jgi:hypothetical protein
MNRTASILAAVVALAAACGGPEGQNSQPPGGLTPGASLWTKPPSADVALSTSSSVEVALPQARSSDLVEMAGTVTSSHATQAGLQVEWFGANGVSLRTDTGFSGNGGPTRIWMQSVAPNGTKSGVLRVYLTGSAADQPTAHFDSIEAFAH